MFILTRCKFDKRKCKRKKKYHLQFSRKKKRKTKVYRYFQLIVEIRFLLAEDWKMEKIKKKFKTFFPRFKAFPFFSNLNFFLKGLRLAATVQSWICENYTLPMEYIWERERERERDTKKVFGKIPVRQSVFISWTLFHSLLLAFGLRRPPILGLFLVRFFPFLSNPLFVLFLLAEPRDSMEIRV